MTRVYHRSAAFKLDMILVHTKLSSVHLPSFIQQIGHHTHEGLGLDLATLLQLIQVQSEFKPLGSTHKAKTSSYYHCYSSFLRHLMIPFNSQRMQSKLIFLAATNSITNTAKLQAFFKLVFLSTNACDLKVVKVFCRA